MTRKKLLSTDEMKTHIPQLSKTKIFVSKKLYLLFPYNFRQVYLRISDVKPH